MKNKHLVLLALLVPVLALFTLAVLKRQMTLKGEIFTVKIDPLDPRSLLSGNYLVYNIDYKVSNICPDPVAKAYICLKPNPFFSLQKPEKLDCALYIKGKCRFNKRFIAGIERFYIPLKYSSKLEEAFLNHKTELALRVSPEGHPIILNLFIGGISWKEFIEKH